MACWTALSSDVSPEIRILLAQEMAASNQTAPLAVWLRMAQDDDAEVRLSLVGASTPTSVLDALASDGAVTVRQAVAHFVR